MEDTTRHGLRPFKGKPAKAGWTTVHEWLSYHQLKLDGKHASADPLACRHISLLVALRTKEQITPMHNGSKLP